MSADGVRWEHIYRVYELCDCNVSESAQRLNMQRHLPRASLLINERPPLMDEKNSIASLIQIKATASTMVLHS